MTTLVTNEWTDALRQKPWKDREVLCLMSDGTKRTLAWNGMYWYDPVTRIRQRYYEDGLHPTHFYIFENFIKTEDYGN